MALRHIEEARRLSEELGGTDSDVKAYFFGLEGGGLRSVLDEYERNCGKSKREYAEQILPRWRSGDTKMSGLVAERLFNILPPKMPLAAKYSLVRTLWKKYSPRSHASFVLGPDCDPVVASQEIERQLLEAVTQYRIPDPLEKRFGWLSSGDVAIRQELLNHFLEEEKALIASDARGRTQIILDHFRHNGCWTERISQEYRIGDHSLELFFDPRARGIHKSSPASSTPPDLTKPNPTPGQKSGCLVMMAVLTAGLPLAVFLIGSLR
jgi:hypothetical protein